MSVRPRKLVLGCTTFRHKPGYLKIDMDDRSTRWLRFPKKKVLRALRNRERVKFSVYQIRFDHDAGCRGVDLTDGKMVFLHICMFDKEMLAKVEHFLRPWKVKK